MAYYTVAHFLHSDIYGQRRGIANLTVSQMTDGVWEYIFALADGPLQSDIPKATLDAMRREFSYWYPVDVRISGKDLVNNHLVFFLHIHQAICVSSPSVPPPFGCLGISGAVWLSRRCSRLPTKDRTYKGQDD